MLDREKNGWLKLEAKNGVQITTVITGVGRDCFDEFQYGLNWSKENPLKGKTN